MEQAPRFEASISMKARTWWFAVLLGLNSGYPVQPYFASSLARS